MTVPPDVPDKIIMRELKLELYALAEAALTVAAVYLIVLIGA